MTNGTGLAFNFEFNPVINVQKVNVMLQELRKSLGKQGSDINLIDEAKVTAAFKKIDEQAKKAGKGFGESFEEEAKNFPDKVKPSVTKVEGMFSKMGLSLKNTFSTALGVFGGGALLGGTAGLMQGIQTIVKSAIDYQAALADMSAITGVTGDKLAEFGEKAKGLAKSFGGEATEQITVFKGILSRLGPDLAKSPEALNSMTESINTLAKASGLDAATSMQALTTAMLQYGVSLDDPKKASEEMARMMNVMGAGAKEGAAEIPQIALALESSGAMAKTAGVSFEELNAGIQVLATRSKYGSEAGTALRNVMIKLSQGRFMPKQALEGLQQAGVDIDKLSDKTLPLKARLEALGPIMKDDALVVEMFGMENIVAGKALLENTNLLGTFTAKLTGTKTATEQAAINMNTMKERLGRVKATVTEVGVSIGTYLLKGMELLIQAFKFVGDHSKIFLAILKAVVIAAVGWAGAMGIMAISNFAATTSFAALGAAIWAALAPLLPIIAAVAALSVGLYALSGGFRETAKDRLEDAKASEKNLKAQQDIIQSQKKEQQSGLDLIKNYKAQQDERAKLISQKKSTEDIDKQLRNSMVELNKIYPTAIDLTKSHSENLASVSKHTGLSAKSFESMNLETRKAYNTFKSLGQQTAKTKEEQAEYNKAIETLKKSYPGVVIEGGNFTKSMSAIDLAAGNATIQMGKLDGKMNALEKSLARVSQTMALNERDMAKAEGWEAVANTLQTGFGDVGKIANDATGKLDSFYKELLKNPDIDATDKIVAKYTEIIEKSKEMNKFQKDTLLATMAKLVIAEDKYQRSLGRRKDVIPSGGNGGGGGGTPDPNEENNNNLKKTKQTESDILAKLREKYAVELSKFELTLRENAAIEGRKLSEQEELDILKKKHSINQLVANDYLDQEKKLNKLASKSEAGLIKFKPDISDKDKEEFEKNVEDVNKDIRLANIAVLEFSANLKGNTSSKLQDEIEKLKREIEKSQLELKIKMGLAVNSDLTKLNINQLESELAEVNKKISSTSPVSLTPDMKVYYEALKSQQDIFAKIYELRKNLEQEQEDERIAAITDFGLREKEISIANANKIYRERLQQVKGSTREELQAFVDLQNEKFKAEQQYMLRSSSSWSSNLTAFTDSFKNSMQDLAFDFKDEQKAENLKKINEEESALAKSLNSRSTAYEDYLDKLGELDKKRNAESKALNDVFAKTFLSGLQKSFEETKRITQDSLSKTLTQYGTYSVTIKQIDTDLKELKVKNLTATAEEELANNEKIESLTMHRNAVQTKAEEAIRQGYIQTGIIVGTTFGSMLAQQKSVLKSLVLASLSGLKALAGVISAQILGYSLATPDAVATLGASALVKWGILTGLMTAGISAAEAKVNSLKFWRGKVDIQGPGTTTSDSISAQISRRESVVNAMGTIPNIKELIWINKTGRNAFDYYVSNEPDRIKDAFYSIAEAKDLLQMGPVINFLIEEKNREQVSELRAMRQQNQILNQKIDKLTQVVADGYYRRKETFEHNINLEFNDEEIVSRSDRRRLASLRKG